MPGTARVTIYGPIVASAADCNTWPYTTLADVQYQLDNQAPYSDIHVLINSPGGDADEGFGMFDLLRTQPVPVTTEAVGQCSSIASVVFLAGTTRRAHRNVNFTVHFPFGGASGTAAEMQAYVDNLADLTRRLVETYTTRGSVTAEAITPLLSVDTALTTDQLTSFGFATLVVEPVLALASSAKLKPTPATPPAGSNPPALNPMAKKIATPTAGKAPAATAPRMNLTTAWNMVRKAFMDNAEEPRLALSLTTEDGASISVDAGDAAAPAVGNPATDAEGNALVDGSYTLNDGAILVVKDGLVETYTPKAVEASTEGENRSASTATPPTVDVTATPTNLEEANAIIQALRTSAAPQAGQQNQRAQASNQPRRAAAAPVVDQAQLQEALNVLGSQITSNGQPIEANDTRNATNQRRTPPTATVADANSDAAKEAALQRITTRRASSQHTRR